MREWERATWATGQTEAEVIRRVGHKIVARARELTRRADSILILAGQGHNGDDARAAQKFLDERKIEILNVTSPKNDLPKLKSALLQKPALIIDGLFGIGLNRALNDGWKKFHRGGQRIKNPHPRRGRSVRFERRNRQTFRRGD